jgi:hypothetical protein
VRSAPPPIRTTPPVRSAPAPSAPPAARAATPAVRPDPPPARTETPATKPATSLADPLPRVTAILISYDRRFATIADGRVVGVGDSIGRRVVVAIQERSVTLREPSGSEVQVRLGGGG